MSKEEKETNDIFAIAEAKISARSDVAEVPPLQIETKKFVSDGNENIWNGPLKRMDSEEQFQVELQEWKEWAKPWLQDYTDKKTEIHRKKYLRNFFFRMENENDLIDSSGPYEDSDEWEKVHIPHYTGPIGKWSGYYRTKINETEIPEGERVFLRFEGVDYRAEVYLNKKYVGSHEGFFSPFEFDVSKQIWRDKENILLVRIENDYPPFGSYTWAKYNTPGAPKSEKENIEGNKIYAATGIGWDDPNGGWQHCPPGAGIWRPVYLEARPNVCITDIFIRPIIKEEIAEVWIEVDSAYTDIRATEIDVEIQPKNFKINEKNKQVIGTGYNSVPSIKIGLNQYRIPLKINNIHLWEPDHPYLYNARVYIKVEGKIEDVADQHFGMRSFEMDEEGDEKGLKGTLKLNDKKVVLRGINTMGHEQQCVQKEDYEQLLEDLLIAKMCNMNFLRITQRPVQKEVYDMMDCIGLMNQCDLPFFGLVRRGTMEEAIRQSGEMEKLVRSHPGTVISSLINEPFPEAWFKERHRTYYRYELEYMFEACRSVIHVHNPDRVIKSCDGDYDPPSSFGLPDTHKYATWHPSHGPFGTFYKGWLPRVKKDWKTGIGEFGNEGLDTWETAEECYPKEWLPESIDHPWNPNKIPSSQSEDWHRFWYDGGVSYRTWLEASWRFSSWANREMVFALRRRIDRVVSTAYHLLIDAFPTNWMKSVVDFKRRPKAGFYALKDAQSPIAVNIRFDRRQVFEGENCSFEYYLLNDTNESKSDLRIEWFILKDSEVMASGGKVTSIDELCASFKGLFTWMPAVAGKRQSYEVVAQLRNKVGERIHQYSYSLDVFPKVKTVKNISIGIVGEKGGYAWALTEALDYTVSLFSKDEKYDLIVSDDPEYFACQDEEVFKRVENGTGLLLLGPKSEREWKIAEDTVNSLYLGNREFLSFDNKSPICTGLIQNDLFMVYQPETDCPNLITEYGYSNVPSGFNKIIFSGVGGFGGNSFPVPVVISKDIGKGRLVMSHFLFDNRLPSEPVPMMLFVNIMEYLLS